MNNGSGITGNMEQFSVKAVNREKSDKIQQVIDLKTKPLGALGELERIALQLALIQEQSSIEINNPIMLVFAGDHGVSDENISLTNSDVTRQMVLNFLTGGAAINCFCRTNNMDLKVVDAGIRTPVADERLIIQRIGPGTRNLAIEPAMTKSEVLQALDLGRSLAASYAKKGSNLVGFGEMGIGNTTPAACIMSALLSQSAQECVGRGTGISDAQLQRKIEIVETAVSRIQNRSDIIEVLIEVGGYEIVQIAGAMIGAAQHKMAILVDGFITTAAAMIAVHLAPETRDYMFFTHCSGEQGHKSMLQSLEATPLLTLGRRLGEGTGAALALPLMRSAAEFFNHMASFESAGVTL